MRAIKKQLTLKRLIIVIIFVIFVANYIKQEIAIRRIQEDIVNSQEELQELKSKNIDLIPCNFAKREKNFFKV